jgi:hypothetical protein
VHPRERKEKTEDIAPLGGLDNVILNPARRRPRFERVARGLYRSL